MSKKLKKHTLTLKFSLCLAVLFSIVLVVNYAVLAQAADDPITSLLNERDKDVKKIKKLEQQNEQLEQQILALEAKDNEKDFIVNDGAPFSNVDAEYKKSEVDDLLNRISELSEYDEDFKEKSGRAHYNMGNIYYERGEYRRAVIEYFQAVDFMPYDPDAHFNLAFVSAEFLNDHATALKHYQRYLYLKPNAEDIKFIREKILASKLVLKSKINSPLDEDLKGEYDYVN